MRPWSLLRRCALAMQPHQLLCRPTFSTCPSELFQALRILGVDIDATEDDIRTAFRKRALELHPDTNQSNLPIKEAEERFKELLSAFEAIQESNFKTIPKKERPTRDHGFDPDADSKRASYLFADFLRNKERVFARVNAALLKSEGFERARQKEIANELMSRLRSRLCSHMQRADMTGMAEGGGQSRQHGASGHPGVSHVAGYLRSRIPITDETKLRRQLAGPTGSTRCHHMGYDVASFRTFSGPVNVRLEHLIGKYSLEEAGQGEDWLFDFEDENDGNGAGTKPQSARTSIVRLRAELPGGRQEVLVHQIVASRADSSRTQSRLVSDSLSQGTRFFLLHLHLDKMVPIARPSVTSMGLAWAAARQFGFGEVARHVLGRVILANQSP